MSLNGVVMDMGTLATDIVVIMDIQDIDIVADIGVTMDILMGVITGEGTIIHTTGLITEAFMATHTAAITAGAEDSGSASASNYKTEEECRPKRAGAGALIRYRLCSLTSIRMWLLSTYRVDESYIVCVG